MKKYMEGVVFGCLALLVPVSGFACSMAQWDANSGAVIVGNPDSAPAVPRVSEFCGLQVTAPNTGHVQDNSPDGHTQFIARFYVRPNLAGSGAADLFVAYSDEAGASPLVKVSYDGANLDFHAAAGVLATAPAAPNLWHLVEIEYNSTGTTHFWVDANAATDPQTGQYASATGAVSSVRLGLPNGGTGFTGPAQFDAYESHSTTPVGTLVIGDANKSGGITPTDLTRVKNEILKNSPTPADETTWLSPGQPDCNRTGSVTPTDLTCIKNIILGN
jgi:hypothetical protein